MNVKKFDRNLIVLVEFLTPGLFYVYYFHREMFTNFDAVKLTLFSSIFSMLPISLALIGTALTGFVVVRGRSLGIRIQIRYFLVKSTVVFWIMKQQVKRLESKASQLTHDTGDKEHDDNLADIERRIKAQAKKIERMKPRVKNKLASLKDHIKESEDGALSYILQLMLKTDQIYVLVSSSLLVAVVLFVGVIQFKWSFDQRMFLYYWVFWTLALFSMARYYSPFAHIAEKIDPVKVSDSEVSKEKTD